MTATRADEPEPQPEKSETTDLAVRPPETEAAKFNQVFKWIISGNTEFDICEAIATTFPNDDPSALIRGAVGVLLDVNELHPTIVTAFCFKATKDIYRRAAEMSDLPTALRALRQLRDLIR